MKTQEIEPEPDPADPTNETISASIVENSGGGCSFQSLGSQTSGLLSLLYLFVGLLPGAWAFRRTK